MITIGNVQQWFNLQPQIEIPGNNKLINTKRQRTWRRTASSCSTTATLKYQKHPCSEIAWKNLQKVQAGGFLKWWYPTTMGFPTKNDHFGVFWGYHPARGRRIPMILCNDEIPGKPTPANRRNLRPWLSKSWELLVLLGLNVKCRRFFKLGDETVWRFDV